MSEDMPRYIAKTWEIVRTEKGAGNVAPETVVATGTLEEMKELFIEMRTQGVEFYNYAIVKSN